MWGPKEERKGRGQSNPIAVVLVFGLVIASTTIVVIAGGSAIQSTQSQLGTASAENSMTQLDSQAALVALGQSGSQRVDLGVNTNGGYRVDETTGKMTVEHRKSATTDVIFSKDLGAVTHESDDGTTIAYQGGGVWRSTGAGESVMVSPPEFHYRGSTLTLPIITINHGEQITERAVIRRNDTTQHYPNQTRGNVNPIDEGRIFVTVKSEYYQAWGQYFAERTDGVVEYDHPNNEVTVELVTPVRQTTATAAVAGLSSGSLQTQGNGGEPARYDSAQQISGVQTQPKINRIVGTKGSQIAGDNDNNDANDAYDAITSSPDPELNFGGVGSSVEIDNAGQYHLKRLDIGSGQTVTLDTDDGDITIVVDEYVSVDGRLEVDGDNTVRIYVRTMGPSGTVSTGWRDAGLKVHGGNVDIPGNDSPQLRIYGNDTFNASVEQGQFNGVVWAPVGAGGPGGFRVRQSDVYGSVVSGDVQMENKGRIHYDEALRREEIVSPDESVTEITYLHVSTNEINVTSG